MFRTTAIAAIAAFALSGAAFAQEQEGLVNVNLSEIVVQDIAQDINVDVGQIPLTVQVPVGVAANICGVDANVLAQQKKDGDVSCDATSSSQALSQIVQREIGSTQQ
jgi:hypothetical protein